MTDGCTAEVIRHPRDAKTGGHIAVFLHKDSYARKSSIRPRNNVSFNPQNNLDFPSAV